MAQRECTIRQAEYSRKRTEVQTINIQRNPYLAEYEAQAHRNAGCRKTDGNVRRRRMEKRRLERMRRRRRMLIGSVCIVLVCVFFYQILKRTEPADDNILPARQAEARKAETSQVNLLSEQKIQGLSMSKYGKHPTWKENFLTPNAYSRPEDALREINSVFVHYTANPGTSAAQNRSYFEQQKDTHERSVSAHFIIGYEGEIIQCIPLDEIAYAVQTRNEDSVSIECCYLAENGSFTQETYDSLIKLLQWLVESYDLDVDKDILRHYDCGGKKCPIYYTENEDAWLQLKEDVKTL